MFIRVVSEQPVQRFGGVNVPAGRCHGRGPRGFHTPYSTGPAWRQGPRRFNHVNVSEAGGLGEPAGRVQPAIVSDNHRAPVRKRYRAPWLQSWRVELRERVLRERVLGLSAVWPLGCASVSSESGRMASGIWPCGLWTLAAWRFLICAR